MAQKVEDFGGLPGVAFNGLQTNKTIAARVETAVTAAGDATPAITFTSSATPPGIYVGSGAPTISAPQGSLYIRTDGSSTSTRLYVNTTGSTTWTNVTTAA